MEHPSLPGRLTGSIIAGRHSLDLGDAGTVVKAGEKLRQLRLQLDLTTRDTADLSRKIAAAEGSEEFAISHARLVQIENDESTPSIYKLFTLSAIYARPFTELVSLYLDLANIARHHCETHVAATRVVTFEANEEEPALTFPIRFDPGFTLQKTNLLSRMVELWGEVPVALLRVLEIRKHRYGFIGMEDYTMYPLLRPGSFVQIDDRQKLQPHKVYRSEYDRPIWFLELRDRYVCSWCELHPDRIIAVPHPLSPARTQEFAMNEVDIVGRVTAMAVRLVNAQETSPNPAPKLPARP